jgi:hypothetical protein
MVEVKVKVEADDSKLLVTPFVVLSRLLAEMCFLALVWKELAMGPVKGTLMRYLNLIVFTLPSGGPGE